MKKYNFVAIILMLVGLSTTVQAEKFEILNKNLEKQQQSVEQLSQSALFTAKRFGTAEVDAIFCDPLFNHCSCQRTINCVGLLYRLKITTQQ